MTLSTYKSSDEEETIKNFFFLIVVNTHRGLLQICKSDSANLVRFLNVGYLPTESDQARFFWKNEMKFLCFKIPNIGFDYHALEQKTTIACIEAWRSSRIPKLMFVVHNGDKYSRSLYFRNMRQTSISSFK